MPIIGHGVDLVPVSRIQEMVDRHGDRFLERCFTPAERAHSDDRRRRFEHLAGRFAAKEAALKALGTGWRSGIAWTDVEVTIDAGGRPSLTLHGQAKAIAADLGIARWSISISHTDEHAMASAIAEGP